MKWENVNLGEIAEFKNGLNFNKDQYGQGVKYISVADFQDYFSAKIDGLAELKEDFINQSYLLKEGDILFVRSNGNKELVGRNLFIDNTLEPLTFSGFCIRARFIKEDVLPKFYAYLFKSKFFRNTLSANAGGTNINNLNQGILSNLNIPKPPLPTQRRIATILSAYDDLIENNLKRIKLLEEKAQLHYMELMQDSAKWDKMRLEEFVSVVKGRKPANVLEQPEEESQLYLLLDTVERGKTLYTTDLSLPQSKNTDVLMCMDGARSGLSFRGMVGAIGSTMAIWRSNSERVSGEFLYQFMKQNESAITQGNTGAAIPHANRRFILDMKMAIPPKNEAENFDGLTLPTIKLINTLYNQNTKLREARDILLPKLMNGAIEV
jgi:type I restriction enzyme, S subunit